MTTTYGLTVDGFVRPSLNDIRDGYNTSYQAEFGASVDVSDSTPEGQVFAIVAEALAKVWEQMQVVVASQDPDQATGAFLEALCALTGTLKRPATHSSVTATLTGTPTTVVNSGSRAALASTGAQWVSVANGTITAVPSRVSNHAYVVGDRVTDTDGTTARVYQCITAGTSGPTSADGPGVAYYAITDPLGGTIIMIGRNPDSTDGTVHWTYLGDGTGACDVKMYAVNTGKTVGTARDLTNAAITPVSGWQSVINLTAATLGRLDETDPALRIRREAELATAGTSPADAVRVALLAVKDVSAATLFYNNGDVTDADGVPPHSVEALVRDGADQDILNCLWNNVAVGIGFQGTVTGTVIDSAGTAQTVKFSRPAAVPIYVTLDVVKDPRTFPSDGDVQIKNAIVAWGALRATGDDARASRILTNAFSVAGVLDVTSCKIDIAPAPTTSTTIVITPRQLATYAFANIVVNLTNGTP